VANASASGQHEFFVADGLTFGVRIGDGAAAVATGDDEAARDRIIERLSDAPPIPERRMSSHDPAAEARNLTLMVAQRCNLRCTYCYGKDGEYGSPGMLDAAAARSAISMFMVREGPEERTINFFGGEPLLAFPTIRQLVKHALRLAVASERTVKFTMTTNATLVSEAIARWLAPLPFSVMVSIDGDPEMHGRNRPDAAGRSSWESVLRGARLLLKYLGPGRVRARGTLTSGYPEVERMVATLEEIGFTRISLTPVEAVDENSGEEGWIAADHERLRAAMSRSAARPRPAGTTPSWDPLADTIGLLASGKRRERPCGVGNAARAASSDGHLYPCHRYVGDQRFVLGPADSAVVDTTAPGFAKFEQMRQTAIEECSSCFAQAFCAGGCAHVALVRMDAGLAPHERNECDSIRWQTREAIRVFAGLRQPPAPARAELLDPAYLLRPAPTSDFRSVLESVIKARPARKQYCDPKFEASIAAEYSSAMATMATCLAANGQHEDHPEDFSRHDWLTVSLPRFLVEQGVLPPPVPDDARAIGLATAIVAHIHGLGHMQRAREAIQIAWVAGYTRVLTDLRGLPSGDRLADRLLHLLGIYLEARSTEGGWDPHQSPANWREITGAKHRPLAFPAMAMAIQRGLPDVAEDIACFANKVGTMRQYVDDYVDVVEDLSKAKVNRCVTEVQQQLGEVASADWPRVLAHRNVADLIRGILSRDAVADGEGPYWSASATAAYTNWLSSKLDKAHERWYWLAKQGSECSSTA